MDADILEEIINHLGVNYNTSDETILTKIYERMMLIASDVTRRAENDTKLIPYVKNATVEAYLRRGKEGTTGYSEGSESESYIDIEEKLRKDVVSIRRIF